MVLKYKDMHAFDNYKTMKIIYSMYRAGKVSVHQACCERATQSYWLGEGGTIYPGSRPAKYTPINRLDSCQQRVVFYKGSLRINVLLRTLHYVKLGNS